MNKSELIDAIAADAGITLNSIKSITVKSEQNFLNRHEFNNLIEILLCISPICYCH